MTRAKPAKNKSANPFAVRDISKIGLRPIGLDIERPVFHSFFHSCGKRGSRTSALCGAGQVSALGLERRETDDADTPDAPRRQNRWIALRRQSVAVPRLGRRLQPLAR